jgi:ammonia channel protein AmtB
MFTYDLGLTMNGCLTGLVSVTAGGATVRNVGSCCHGYDCRLVVSSRLGSTDQVEN